jgi:hypothetical protein
MEKFVAWPLHRGGFALIDEVDLPLIEGKRWSSLKHHATYYATAALKQANKAPYIRMHRLIMGAGPGQVVDHINGNGWDNRRANLRLCLPHENQKNRGLYRTANKTSRFKGVSYQPLSGMWTAVIHNEKKVHYLGSFAKEVEAARAYDGVPSPGLRRGL